MNKIRNVEIRKTGAADFEQVYPLLLKFNNPKISKSLWRNLFADRWNFQKGFVGYKLVSSGRIVGFSAYILSKRKIGEQEENFCVLSSVIAQKEFRAYAMELIYPILDLKDHTIISFTPTQGTFDILTKVFNFQVLDTHERVVPILITPAAFLKKTPKIFRSPELILSHLTPEEKKLARDHMPFNCQHVCFLFPDGHLYVIAKKKYLRNIPFHKIYHMNHPELMMKYFSFLRFHLPRILGSFGIIIDSRFLGDRNIPFSLRRDFYMPMAYTSTRVLPQQIDYLYSEFFLLEE